MYTKENITISEEVECCGGCLYAQDILHDGICIGALVKSSRLRVPDTWQFVARLDQIPEGFVVGEHMDEADLGFVQTFSLEEFLIARNAIPSPSDC